MVPDGCDEVGEGTIVHVGGFDGDVAQRGCPELVAVLLVAGEVFTAIVLVGIGAVELVVSQLRDELGDADRVFLEVGEHLVGAAGDAVATDASGPAEKEERAALLGRS